MIGSKINEAASAYRNQVPADMRSELEEVVPESDLWLTTPHEMLGGRTPLDVASSSEKGKEIVWNLIRLIKSGSFT